jgi:catechol 2,3-dioxygenase-like lactoylglutathione lyase family enzyme
MIRDLGHPAFAAHDVDRTLDFYALLGIGEGFRLHHDDGSPMLVYPHVSGDRFVEVFLGGPPPDPYRPQGFMHLCLITDGIETVVEHLRQNGTPIDSGTAPGLDGNLQFWTRDPDGNQIEFMQLSEDSPRRTTARSAAGDRA